jgi:DNA helicase-2/ATP-dependent DNA helicase PcrA
MSFLNDLNPEQKKAVEAVTGPVMIIAGAGSGKTRVLTYRVAHLITLGIRPESILALTFTNKAANEMKGRISALVGEASRSVWMGTFHSTFARILRFEAERIGYQRNFTIYDSDDSLTLVRGIMNTLGISGQQFSPQGIRARISKAKNAMVTPRAMREAGVDAMTERTASVFEEYERRVKKSNAMDFDDLLLKPLDLFTHHPDVLERYQYRFRHIMVDEYQDTNRVQYALIRKLADLDKNICVVGDDAQSIYAFRGADIRNILDFEKDYPDCAIFRLEQNYRSTKTILGAADSLMKNNVDQMPKKLWTANEAGEQIIVQACEDDREEGYKVVARIQEESLHKKIDLKDFAVLYRTNAQSRSIEDVLRRNAIPYVIVGGVAFYKRKEIKDVLAYLNVIANPQDTESLLRIINVPPRGIGGTTLKKIRDAAEDKKVTLYEGLALAELETLLAGKTLAAVRKFRALLQKYIGLKGAMSVGEMVRTLVDEIEILQELQHDETPEGTSRSENVEELVSALADFSARAPDAKLEDFLEEVSLVSDLDQADFGRNAVTLMSLHAAKGLEFPVVFITGMEEGIFPLAGAVADRKELEEERRLMYVGMTRAKRKLYLFWALSRYRHGEVTHSLKSRFLGEIDQSLLEEDQRASFAGRPYRRAAAAVPTERNTPRTQPSWKKHEEAKGFDADPLPDYEGESQDVRVPAVGSHVEHETFGDGRILAIEGRGENARAIVDFAGVGKKHLMLKFANLKLR